MTNKILFFLVISHLFINSLYSQESALAYPVENINIDGSFKEWPEPINWYRMTHHYNNDNKSNEDFAAQFAAAFNEKEQAIYIAVQVLDDDFVGENGKSHTTQDHMLLYVDVVHEINGGSPLYFVVTDSVLEVHHKLGTFDTRNHFIQLDNAQSARKRTKNSSQYEFKITLNEHVKPNTVLGLDFMLIDTDTDDQNQGILLWKDGFGKSNGAQKLGDLLLLQEDTDIGKVEGYIDMTSLDDKEMPNSIDIVSVQNPDIWIKTTVDTTGYFQAFIPVGTYNLNPNRLFTSPVYSEGFLQNTRKLRYSNRKSFQISKDKTTVLDTVKLAIIPQPKIEKTTETKLPIEYASKKEIDDFVNTWKAYFGIPAVSVAVIRDNKVFYNKTFGVKNKLTKEKVTEQTLFEAASITKSVFGVLMLRLAEKGIIDLDKPLHEYLTFPNIENDERSKLLTARIILGHQSGLPNWAWDGPGTWKDGGEIQLNFTPGTEFGYSGEAFNYLGRVVEHITQKKLQTLYEEEIFEPFGIKNSALLYIDELEDRTAVGHMQQYFQIKQKDLIVSPASSLQTNANLFNDFVLKLMNEKGMSTKSYNLIYNPYTVLKPDQKIYSPHIDQHVSHGFFVQTTSNGKLIGHGGNNGDYDSKFMYNPNKKFAYIVFTNSNLGDEFIRAFEKYLLNQ